MARVISDILDADALQFKHLIEKWERRTGYKGHDLSLYSDMRSEAIAAINGLGLDPTDTVSGELYFALQERARQDNEWLASHIKVEESDTPDELMKKIVAWVQRHASSTDVWVCKQSLIRGLLKKQPPKSVMKSLGLRSVDSMLKRNNSAEILTLAYELESPEWTKKFKLQLKKCKTSDFDVTKIQFVVLPKERMEKIKKAGYPVSRIVSPNYELGGVLILPALYRFPLDVLAAVVSVAEAIYDIRKHSSLYRTLSVRKDFGLQFYNISSLGLSKASQSMSEVGWNSLHRHLVGNDFVMAKIEQPHLTKEDMHAENSLNFLLSQDRRFRYWKNLEYAVFSEAGKYPVSLNLVDVVMNASNRLPYGGGSLSYARMRLWEELWARYLNSDKVIEDVVDSYLKQ